MKFILMTKQFSPIARIGKELERIINLLKYKAKGDRFRVWACSLPLGGHPDVVDSIIKGAESFPEVELLINPRRSEIKDSVVCVVGNWRAVQELIPLRECGYISKLIVKSTTAFLPGGRGFLITNPAIDSFLGAAEWAKEMIDAALRNANLSANTGVWGVGVDHIYWANERQVDAGFRKALIFVKKSGRDMLPAVTSLLNKKNIGYEVIEYGYYIPQDYKVALDQSDFVIVLGECETQGLALFQAWSMDRQTLVYDSSLIPDGYDHAESARHFANAAPYLTPQTGAFWKTTAELEYQIDNITRRSPREWIMANFTNELAFGRLLRIIEDLE